MVFKLSATFASPANSQSGMPTPGAGAQTTGNPTKQTTGTPWFAKRPTQGRRSWLNPLNAQSSQRGTPAPQNGGQKRPPGSMPNVPPVSGLNNQVYTPYFSRGAAAYVQNYGKILTNPIGAGVVARYRPMASYGGSAQYADGAIWWSNQVIPTSIDLQGLTDPQELAAILDPLQIQAVVRTTG